MASTSIFCDSVAWEAAQLLLPQLQPKPYLQATQQALLKQAVHYIHALLPWTKENVTFIGHEENVKDP